MTYYLKFVAVYMSTLVACGLVRSYSGLSDALVACISILFIFLSVPAWAFWAGKGKP